MLERECYERVNINTRMGRDKLGLWVPEVLLKRMWESWPSQGNNAFNFPLVCLTVVCLC